MNLALFVVVLFIFYCVSSAVLPLHLSVGRTASNESETSTVADNAFYDMAQRMLKAMDSVTGKHFITNWFALLSDNVTVCYPFVGAIDSQSCLFGLEAVIKAWTSEESLTNFTAIEQDAMWISYAVSGGKMATWKYTTSSSYVSPNSGRLCVVQFQGVVHFALDSSNPEKISMWLEAPDSTRISNTYPCL